MAPPEPLPPLPALPALPPLPPLPPRAWLPRNVLWLTVRLELPLLMAPWPSPPTPPFAPLPPRAIAAARPGPARPPGPAGGCVRGESEVFRGLGRGGGRPNEAKDRFLEGARHAKAAVTALLAGAAVGPVPSARQVVLEGG